MQICVVYLINLYFKTLIFCFLCSYSNNLCVKRSNLEHKNRLCKLQKSAIYALLI